jgi:uncharacterized protein
MVSKKFVTLGTVIVSTVGVLCLRQSSGAQGLSQLPSASSEILPTLSQLSDHGEPWLSGSLAQEQAISENDRKMLVQQRYAMERELEGIAVIDRKVWIPMRDGEKMAADIYRPKSAEGRVPIILQRTPYNFNYWDVMLGAPADMSKELYWVKHGYAYVQIQERGHYFSQGNYEILGAPRTDGVDEISRLTSESWSNGKLAPIGCSSSAEWQLGVAAENPPGLTTFNVEGFGAGIGRVGPYYEQGNWFRGGSFLMLFMDWLYTMQNQAQPIVPPNLTQLQRIEMGKMFNLVPTMPPVDWDKAIWHLPVSDTIRSVGGPPGIFETPEPVPTGGDMIARVPNSAAWYKGGLWNDSMPIHQPGLWFMSWYDVSISPNLAAYNFVRRTAPPNIANEQYAIIAPGLHCEYTDTTSDEGDHKVGDLDVGDSRYPYGNYILEWFDHFLKDKENGVLKRHAKVTYYLMGKNVWKDSPTWPPPGVQTQTFYLSSAGHANTMYGDGTLAVRPAAHGLADRFVYDPANPVPTLGGVGCCLGATRSGSLDQRPIEARNDVLVYTTPPLKNGMEVSGPITVTLYVSSDAKDTDFTFKVMDVYPDGTAYDLTSNIQRMRWREGYDHKAVWMQDGHVYKVTFQPIDISEYVFPGHRLRLSVSSSDFPLFERNLNTAANNETTSAMAIAHNVVYDSSEYASSISLTVVPASRERPTDPVSLAYLKRQALLKNE